jgi:hypothetical protein
VGGLAPGRGEREVALVLAAEASTSGLSDCKAVKSDFEARDSQHHHLLLVGRRTSFLT